MNPKWEQYPYDRKISYHENFVIIVPSNYDENNLNNMPLFCDVCELSFSSKEDEKTYKQFKCCSSCADTWAFSNKEKWKLGWRPDKKDIVQSVEKRSFVNSDIVFE